LQTKLSTSLSIGRLAHLFWLFNSSRKGNNVTSD